MTGGVDQLREQLAALERTMQSFEDPVVHEHPGLGLMKNVLQERAEHIREQIARQERTSLELRLAGEPVSDGTAALAVVAALLTALQDAVGAFADGLDPERGRDAAALHLAQFGGGGDDVTLVVTRRPGPFDAQLAVVDSGAHVVDLALEALCDTLASPDDATGVDAGTAEPLRCLADLLLAQPVALTLTARPATRGERRVQISRADAARLRDALPAPALHGRA